MTDSIVSVSTIVAESIVETTTIAAESIIEATTIEADSLIDSSPIVADSTVEVTEIQADSVIVAGTPGRNGSLGGLIRERLTPYPDGTLVDFWPVSGKTIQIGTEWVKCNGIPNQRPFNYDITAPNKITFTSPPGPGWYLTIEYEELET